MCNIVFVFVKVVEYRPTDSPLKRVPQKNVAPEESDVMLRDTPVLTLSLTLCVCAVASWQENRSLNGPEFLSYFSRRKIFGQK